MTEQLEHRYDPETLRAVHADPAAVLAHIEQLRAEVRDAPDEIAGTAPKQHLARLRLARVHQWRGEFVESNIAFTELLNAAGQNDFDQGHFADALGHFTQALAIRREFELPEDQIASSQLALAAAQRRLEAEK